MHKLFAKCKKTRRGIRLDYSRKRKRVMVVWRSCKKSGEGNEPDELKRILGYIHILRTKMTPYIRVQCMQRSGDDIIGEKATAFQRLHTGYGTVG